MKTSIGAVGFAHITDGRLSRYEVMGDERVALLQRVLDDEPLPDGLILIRYTDGGPIEAITRDDVRWDTSSLKPRGVRP